MTPSQLKAQVIESDKTRNFFNRSTMRFFGDTMANYGVRSVKVKGIDCWELYRKKPVKCGLIKSTFFDKQSFDIVYP